MFRERVIPIDSIPKGANIVLFGAGKIGQLFWKQNQLIDWCHISLVVDTNYHTVENFPTEVGNPEEIFKLEDIDYVLIAVLSKTSRKEIRKILQEGGIPAEKIIEELDCYFENDNIERTIIYNNAEVNSQEEILKIGLDFRGLMGDCIIFLKFYQELVQIAPKSEIDVFNSNIKVLESIMYGQKNQGCIKEKLPPRKEYQQYDVIVQLLFEPFLLWINFDKVQNVCPELARRMILLSEYQKNDYAYSPVSQYSKRIIVDRARLQKRNRYTLMRVANAFEIKDQYVDFYINPEYEEEYRNLELNKPYITFNYGANTGGHADCCQIKMWPYEYHISLNKMLKKRFPNVEIIQLGAADVKRIPYSDRYILGRHLDVAKQVLQNAVCHFDCEGGLVHMATQLGTKCFVVFGPTPVWFFGYDRNENIAPKFCGECKGLVKDWYTRCFLYDKPECMYSITPKYVFALIKKYLEGKGF